MTPIITVDQVSFKLENLNPTGSAKDRALKSQIKNLIKLGYSSAVISSSGNAAISAAHYCHRFGIPLTVFLSPQTPKPKINLIKKYPVSINLTPTPNSNAFRFAKTTGAYNLRQSTDPFARRGYRQIGRELSRQLPEVTSIFLPVGSGTTLLGISDQVLPSVKLYAVQPASWAPIASRFDTTFTPESTTITDALSVKMLPQLNTLLGLLSARGGGVVAQNSEVVESLQWLSNNNISVSPETALALAGLWKLRTQKPDLVGDFPLVVVTGALRNE